MQQHYDLLYIIPGTTTEEEAQATTSKIHELVTSLGATITKSDFWGKRKLAYEINHIRHGFYELIEFDLDTLKLAELENTLRLHDQVLRHQITIRKVLSAEQLAAAQQLRERIAARRETVKEKAAAAMLTPEAPAAEPAPVETGPVQKEQFEKKLEQILDSDKVEL